MPTVSVIIPCYNCEKYINDTLKSIEEQTFKDYEVICINDGSKDSTLSILESWKLKINLKVFDQKNAGVSAARNKGIEASNGKYIMFCDADDLYHPQMLEMMVSAMRNNDADTAYCLFSHSSSPQFFTNPGSCGLVLQNQQEAMKKLLYNMGMLSFCCYIYNKEILENEGLRFDINTKHFEDREFNWKYLTNCNRIVFIESVLYWYRRTEESATSIQSVEWRTDSILAARRIEQYLKEKNSPYYSEVKSYLLPRVVWGLARKYAASGSKDNFRRLQKEEDLDSCMRTMSRDNNSKVAVLSKLFLISPRLFYIAAYISAKIYKR